MVFRISVGGKSMRRITTWLAAAVFLAPIALPASAADREPKTDLEFLAWAIACEQAEVKFADRAIKKATSTEVRQLAEAIRSEHAKTRDALLEHAKTRKLAVVEGLEKHHREEYQRLGKLSGAAFDREYVKYLVDGHEKGARMYQKWAKEASDASLRQTARQAMKTTEDHLAKAKKLAAKLKE